MNTLGNKLKVTVFGQSHAPAIGCVIDGLPAGFFIQIRSTPKPGKPAHERLPINSRNGERNIRYSSLQAFLFPFQLQKPPFRACRENPGLNSSHDTLD